MKIELLSLSSSNESWVTEALATYKKKISYLTDFDVVHLKPTKGARKTAQEKKLSDSELLLSYIKPHDFVIVCDEKGRSFDSMSFSKKLETVFTAGNKRILFIIGGPYGLTDDLKRKSHLQFSLSPLTFNHWLAEIVLAEQIYRALSIQRNLPYHNE